MAFGTVTERLPDDWERDGTGTSELFCCFHSVFIGRYC
jgi:hypothetical protein